MALKKNVPASETPAESTQAPVATTTRTRLRKDVPPPPPPPPVEPEMVENEEEQAEPVSSQAPASAETLTKTETRPATRSGAGTAVAPSGQLGLVSPLNQLKDNLPPGELEFGSLERYKASNGQIMDSKNRAIGSWAQFEPVSFNSLWMVAPGESDDESKEYLAFSYDGEMVKDGSRTLQEALAEAKAAGYDKAAIKEYVELFGILLDAEKIPDGDSALGKLVMFSLSPQSVKKWNGFKAQVGVQIKMNRMKVEDLTMISARVNIGNFGGKDFSYFDFEV